MQELQTFILDNRNAIYVLTIWEIIWKGLALWRAAKRNSKNWFVALFLLNTLGLLPIGYLIATRDKTKKSSSSK